MEGLRMLAGEMLDRLLAEHGIDVTHFFAPHLYAKRTAVPAGKRLIQHAHRFAHLSVIADGRALVEVGGVQKEHGAGECLVIAAGKVHSVTAITDLVWFCIHATDETEPAAVDAAILAGNRPAKE